MARVTDVTDDASPSPSSADDDFPAPPTLDELPNEVSLEQCERLLCALHYAECREMCETVYRTYAADPNAARPIRGDSRGGGSRAGGGEGQAVTKDDDDDDDDDDDNADARLLRRRRRRTAEEKAVMRRMGRPFEYVHEMTGECSCSDEESPGYEERREMIRTLEEDEARRRWPPEDLYGRDATLVSSCLWVQAKFKTVGLAATIEEDYDALRGDVGAETCGEWGPEARVFWCKLKWEEGAAKRAFSEEERAVERAILDTFKRCETLGIFDIVRGTLAPEDVRETWVEALGKLAWLYASQILAAQREDEDAAYAWMDANASMLPPEIVLVIKQWIDDANKPPRYATTIEVDETTMRRTVTHEELRRPSRSKSTRASSERRASIDDDGREEEEEEEARASSPSPPDPADARASGERDENHHPRTTDDAPSDDRDERPHKATVAFNPAIETVREIARDPAGDVALRAYAVVAVSVYAAWSLARAFQSWTSTDTVGRRRRAV